MLGDGGIAGAETVRKLADRALALDQPAHQQQPVPVGEGFQEIGRCLAGRLHLFRIYIHYYEYT